MKATFNGAEHEFHIARQHVSYLESSLGRGLYAVLKDFTEDRWTFGDVAMVVSFALHGPAPEDKLAINTGLQTLRLGMSPSAVGTTSNLYGRSYRPHPDVIALLERDGHGNFAPLAADVLTHTIFGATNGEA